MALHTHTSKISIRGKGSSKLQPNCLAPSSLARSLSLSLTERPRAWEGTPRPRESEGGRSRGRSAPHRLHHPLPGSLPAVPRLIPGTHSGWWPLKPAPCAPPGPGPGRLGAGTRPRPAWASAPDQPPPPVSRPRGVAAGGWGPPGAHVGRPRPAPGPDTAARKPAEVPRGLPSVTVLGVAGRWHNFLTFRERSPRWEQ